MRATTNPTKTKVPPRATTLAVTRSSERSKKPGPESMDIPRFIKWFGDIGIEDVP